MLFDQRNIIFKKISTNMEQYTYVYIKKYVKMWYQITIFAEIHYTQLNDTFSIKGNNDFW